MNRYEGLNLPQLFELMHPLVEPLQIPYWPQTAGWKVLLLWFFIVIVMSCVRFALNRQQNRYRRDALEELRTIAASVEDNTAGAAAAIAGLLKRTALAAFPRSQVASLYGHDWADFLIETSDNDPLVRSKALELATAAYRREGAAYGGGGAAYGGGGAAYGGRGAGAPLVEAARRWIKQHRV